MCLSWQKQLQLDESHPSNEVTPGTSKTAAASQGSGTPWKTPAPVFAEPKTPGTAVAASGWQELCCEEGKIFSSCSSTPSPLAPVLALVHAGLPTQDSEPCLKSQHRAWISFLPSDAHERICINLAPGSDGSTYLTKQGSWLCAASKKCTSYNFMSMCANVNKGKMRS